MAQVVQRSAELKRIKALPRRNWEALATPELIEKLSRHLRTPEGNRIYDAEVAAGRDPYAYHVPILLLPVQAAYLVDLHDTNGAFLQAGVGHGKTLASLLAATVLGARRPLLIVPADLTTSNKAKGDGKTERDIKRLSKIWRIIPIDVQSYQRISRSGGERFLLHHDLFVLDESHFCKNKQAAVTRKINRHIGQIRNEEDKIRQATHPSTWVRRFPVSTMSGTHAKRSLLDFAHTAEWTSPDMCPIPLDDSDQIFWAGAIDEKVAEQDRFDVGALLELATVEDAGLEPRTIARRAVQRRIFETPGFIATKAQSVDCPLVVECEEFVVSPEIDAAFRTLKEKWATPDGHTFADGVRLWQHARELAQGFYYRWTPRPPDEWLIARAEWHALCRDILQHRRNLYSEGDIKLEVKKWRADGKIHLADEKLAAWEAQEPTFKINNVPVWVDDRALRHAAKWAEHHTGPIWVEHRAVGERLAEMTGLRYYTNEGFDAAGNFVEDHPPDQCAILSVQSNKTGKNLQFWSEAYILSMPPTGTTVEQLMGRLHRQGQKADVVKFWVMIACLEQFNGFSQAMRDANFHSDLLRSDMKLGTNINTPFGVEKKSERKYADILVPPFRSQGWAWKEPIRE